MTEQTPPFSAPTGWLTPLPTETDRLGRLNEIAGRLWRLDLYLQRAIIKATKFERSPKAQIEFDAAVAVLQEPFDKLVAERRRLHAMHPDGVERRVWRIKSEIAEIDGIVADRLTQAFEVALCKSRRTSLEVELADLTGAEQSAQLVRAA